MESLAQLHVHELACNLLRETVIPFPFASHKMRKHYMPPVYAGRRSKSTMIGAEPWTSSHPYPYSIEYYYWYQEETNSGFGLAWQRAKVQILYPAFGITRREAEYIMDQLGFTPRQKNQFLTQYHNNVTEEVAQLPTMHTLFKLPRGVSYIHDVYMGVIMFRSDPQGKKK